MSNVICLTTNKILLQLCYNMFVGVNYAQRSFLSCCYDYCLACSLSDVNNYDRPNIEDLIIKHTTSTELDMTIEYIIAEISNEITVNNIHNPVIGTINQHVVTIEDNILYTQQ